MVGPSSSHTAGACRIGLFARALLGAGVDLPDSGTVFLSVRKADRAAACILGRKLRQLGQRRQVLSVTHLPVIAALTGLKAGIPVAVGTGDDFSNVLGAGVVRQTLKAAWARSMIRS